MDKLLHCPFCGSAAKHEVWSIHNYHRVGCEECDFERDYFEDAASAMAAWNTRADQGGEAVAWMRRNVTYKAHDGSNLTGRTDGERILSERKVYEDDMPLYTHPPRATAVEESKDREMLKLLMQEFDITSWQCPKCGHDEECSTMDSAHLLREYLSAQRGEVANG